MAKLDEKGPMQPPRKTCDVMKAASAIPMEENEPDTAHTDAATHTVRTGQEDG